MRSLVTGLFALAILSIAAEAADASCAPMSLTERFGSADVVVEGTVARASEPGFYEVAVRRVLKGTASGTVTVRGSDAGSVVSSVDIALTTDGTYTLYLRRDLDAFTTNACSGSHAGAATAEELALAGPQGPGRAVDAAVGPGAVTGTGDAAFAPNVMIGLVAGAALFILALAAVRLPRSGRE